MVPTTVAGCVLLAGCMALLGGCAQPDMTIAKAVALTGVPIGGGVHGGQQPISGATIQLYAAGSSGYGSAASTLLTTDVVTGSDGSFTITGNYTCPSAATPVYLTAVGGNPGLGGNANNAAVALMAALGPCGGLQSATFINVNEVTTVGAVWALSHYMLSYASLGTSATNNAGLTNAFAAANEVVNLAKGLTPGATLPSGATLPVSKINSLANVLAACVNTAGGVAGDGSACGTLFAAATVAGSPAPTDTIAAAINIARNPGSNVASVFGTASPSAPFQPSLSAAPSDWLIGITYTGGGLSSPKALAVDGLGNVWVANGGANSVSQFGPGGAALSPVGGFTGGGLNLPSGIAVSPTGAVWVANSGGNSVSEFSSAGGVLSPSGFTGGGLNAPAAVTIDGIGNVWVANKGNSSVTELSSSGVALSPSPGYVGAGVSSPVGIAVNPH